MSGSATRLRRIVRKEMQAAILRASPALLWEHCARLRWPARLRLAWLLVRGRAFDGGRLLGGE